MFEILFYIVLALLIFRIVGMVDNLIRIRKDKIDRINYSNSFAKKGGIVFFGDSLTSFFPLGDYFENCKIYNRGIASDKTTHLLKRLDNVTVLEPSKLFLQIGTNDMAELVSIKKIARNIELICDEVQKSNADVKIYLVSTYPISRTKIVFSPFICSFRSNKKLRALNELLQEIATRRGFTYIDMYSKLADEKGRLKNQYTVEGLHVNWLGYKIIKENLLEYLNE